MSNSCKNTGKKSEIPDKSLNLDTISKILDLITAAFNLSKKAAPDIPPFLLLTGAKLKPGMSGRNLGANIISKLESEVGIPMGDIFADGPNAMAAAMLVQAKEQVSHIQLNAKVSTVIEPGSIQIQGSGANAAGPVLITGSNLLLAATKGVIQ